MRRMDQKILEYFGAITQEERAILDRNTDINREIYMLTAHLPRINTIKDEEMMELAEFFGVEYRKDFLNI